jgi:hypothetical protein
MLKIGIAVSTREGDDIVFSQMDQYAYWLYKTLEATKMCSDIFLVTSASVVPGKENHWVKRGVPVVTPAFVDGALDLIIEVSGALDIRYLNKQRARGCKVVMGGIQHPYFGGWVEPAIFNRSQFVTSRGRYDAVWIHSQYEEFIPMLRTLYKASSTRKTWTSRRSSSTRRLTSSRPSWMRMPRSRATS